MGSLKTILTNIYSVLAYLPGTAVKCFVQIVSLTVSLESNVLGAMQAERRSTRSEVELKKSERLPGEIDILVRQRGRGIPGT